MLAAMEARVEWPTDAGLLVAIEPSAQELAPHVEALVAAYNEPHNARMLGHAAALGAADVTGHYERLRADGDHGVLLLRDGALVGDGDLRGVTRRACELAFLVAASTDQGRGLGTRFALMLSMLAFAGLGVERVYASVLPANAASLRVFEKLGYTRDPGAEAAQYGDDGDVVLSVSRAALSARHAAAMAEIRVVMR